MINLKVDQQMEEKEVKPKKKVFETESYRKKRLERERNMKKHPKISIDWNALAKECIKALSQSKPTSN